MVKPTRRGILLAAAGAVPAALPAVAADWLWPAWVFFCGAVLCLLGADFIFSPSRRKVDVAAHSLLAHDWRGIVHCGDVLGQFKTRPRCTRAGSLAHSEARAGT